MNGCSKEVFIRNKPLSLVAWAVFSYILRKLLLVLKQGNERNNKRSFLKYLFYFLRNPLQYLGSVSEYSHGQIT